MFYDFLANSVPTRSREFAAADLGTLAPALDAAWLAGQPQIVVNDPVNDIACLTQASPGRHSVRV
jgi:hypothetical protein